MTTLANYGAKIATRASELKDIIFITGAQSQAKFQDDELTTLDASSLRNRIEQMTSIGKEAPLEANYSEAVDRIVSAMNNMASLSYKGAKFLEPSEVKTILDSLENYEERLEKIAEIKKELEEFKKRIQTNYSQKIHEQKEERFSCENQLEMLEKAKIQKMKENLLRTLWPYDVMTERYNRNIESLKTRITKCNFNIQQLTGMRPAANEKDIMLFQFQLKAKFVT